MNIGQAASMIRWIADREMALCSKVNRISRQRYINQGFVVVSRVGDGALWYVLMGVMPLLYGEVGLATTFTMVKVGTVNYLLYKVIKTATSRNRPCALSNEIAVGTAPLDQYSFPSGHTMHAVAFSMIVVASHPEWSIVLLPFTGLVAASRIVLGLHFPTDVAAGAVIGSYVASTFSTF